MSKQTEPTVTLRKALEGQFKEITCALCKPSTYNPTPTICDCGELRGWGDPPPNHRRIPHHHWTDGQNKKYIQKCTSKHVELLAALTSHPSGVEAHACECNLCDLSVGYLCDVHAKERAEWQANRPLDLKEWVLERFENCQQHAATSNIAVREGWLDDARFYLEILTVLALLPQGRVLQPQAPQGRDSAGEREALEKLIRAIRHFMDGSDTRDDLREATRVAERTLAKPSTPRSKRDGEEDLCGKPL